MNSRMDKGSQDEGSRNRPVRVDRELILDLNFVPEWARKPPTQQHYYTTERRERRPASGGRGRSDRRPRPDRRGQRYDRDERSRDRRSPGGGRRRERSDRGPSQVGRGARQRPGGRRDEDTRTRGAPPPSRRFPDAERRRTGESRRPREEPLPVQVRFLPDQKRLSAVVRRIHKTQRAFPLMDLASLFLSHPEICFVRIEVRREYPDLFLYQCRECSAVALDRESLETHVLHQHVKDYFDIEETEGEAPSGQFVCVARCGVTGTLLGPPNHHSYDEKAREVHRRHCPGMSFEAYQSRIEMVHDPELIEQWKETSRRQTVYRLKRKEGNGSEPQTWQEVETYFRRSVMNSTITQCRRVTLPATVAREIADARLLRAVSTAWGKESRFPITLSSALHGAFQHKHLYVFKAGGKNRFVTSTQPVPLDKEHVVEHIREVLSCLEEQPGITRKELVDRLRPGSAMESEEARAVLSPLSWLIERGHIIEFFNGALSVPLGSGRRIA